MTLTAAERRGWYDTVGVTVVSLLIRVVVIGWAASRFPPAADGQFYQVVARRISEGLGYTWLWPDGAVTFAAHYPVGYPALVGALYAVFGPTPVAAMALNGLCGAVTTWSVHRVALKVTGRRMALAAGLVAALHPTLLLYTPAMMTELLSAALVAAAAALALCCTGSQRTLWSSVVAIGLLIGVATLVRPQQVLWAPLFGLLLALRQKQAAGQTVRASVAAVVVSVVAIGCCLPWTVRNCDKMERCVFVSANGGWNLYIGASPKGKGAWTSLDSIGIPEECRLVFQEAAKDQCFGEAAKRIIRAHPWAWVKLIPAKLSKTFDDVGAPGYYLNSSNSAVFGDDAKWWLGAAEVLVQRLLAMAAALALFQSEGPHRLLRRILAGAAIVATIVPFAWLGAAIFCVGAATLGRRLRDEPAILLLALSLSMTAAVHATFFGGARYAIVGFPFVIIAAAQGIGRVLPSRFRVEGGSAGRG